MLSSVDIERIICYPFNSFNEERMRTNPARRQAILEAAQELLLRHGLRGTSMEAIARAAGVAKPTLYAYFPDKAAVFSALVEQLVEAWRRAFLAALGGDGDIAVRVGAALTARHKAAMALLAKSRHAAELYGTEDRLAGPALARLEAELGTALERELAGAGARTARLLAQILLAAGAGIGHKASSPAELGPALRLLAERLIRPELS
jgi:AcrR family transcriptional regulator